MSRDEGGKPLASDGHGETTDFMLSSIVKRHPAVTELLSLVAFLAPRPLHLDVLREAAEILPKRLLELLNDSDSATKALTSLCEANLVVKDGDIFSVGAETQGSIRAKLNHAKQTAWAAAALKTVLYAFPVQSKYEHHIDECDALLPHGLAAIQSAETFGASCAESVDLAKRMGLYSHGCGDYAHAQECLEWALDLSEKAAGPNGPDLAALWNNLGVVQQDSEDFASARDCFAKAEKLLRQKGEGPRESLVQPLRNLYLVQVVLEDWSAAQRTAERAAGLFHELYDVDHPHVAECLSVLGTACARQNDVEAAKKHFDKAVLSVSYAKPYSAHDVALCKRSYGVMLVESGEYSDAEEEFRGALELNRSAFGDAHLSVAEDLTELGRSLHRQDRHDEAEEYFKESLAICQAIEGEHSIHQLGTLKCLCDLFADMGNSRGICICLARELAIKEARYGRNAPELARSLIRLGREFESREKYADAERCLGKALRIHEKHGSLSASEQASSNHYLGRVLEVTDRADEALVYLEKSIEIRLEHYGPLDARVGRDSLKLGRLLVERGQRLKGIGQFAVGLRCYEGRLGKEHEKVVEIREEFERIKKRRT